MKENRSVEKQVVYIVTVVMMAVLALRFVVFYFKSDGLSGMSFLYSLLIFGIVASWLLMSSFFAAWVYQDCKKRNDDGILWAVIVFVTTPFIGLLVYFLRRAEIKRECAACGHPVSLQAKYCEECGTKIEIREEMKIVEKTCTHHISFILIGVVCMVLMVSCLTGFIVNAAAGKGINSDAAAGEKVWNLGSITMNYENYKDGVWNLDFRKASDGFTAEQKMTVKASKSEYLYAEVSCKTVPEGAALTLYLVQGDVVKTFDVTDLSEPLKYSLEDFEDGKLYVRLLIEGVEDTVSRIYIE